MSTVSSDRRLFHSPADLAELSRVVELRLMAFQRDRNPVHVREAWRAIRKASMQPGESIFRALDDALDLVIWRGPVGGHGPQFTMRDIEMRQALLQLIGGTEIPAVIPMGAKAQIAKRFRVTFGAANMIFSRLRRPQRRAAARA